MRLGSHVSTPLLPAVFDGKLAVLRLLRGAADTVPGATPRRMPWRRRPRRRSPGGCLLDPGGTCVLSSLLLDADVPATLDLSPDAGRPAPRRRHCGDVLEELAAELAKSDIYRELARPEHGAQLEADPVISGDRPREARVALDRWIARAACRHRRRQALAGVALTLVSTAHTVPICLLAGAPARITAGVVITMVTSGTALSLLAFLHQTETGWPLVQLITGLLCETGLGIFLIVDGALNRVLVGDEVATLIGISAAGASLLLQAAVARLKAP